MNTTSANQLNKIYAGSGYRKKEKLRVVNVQKKMQQQNWKISAAKDRKPVVQEDKPTILAASQSQTHFNTKDRFAFSHGSGGFYREGMSTNEFFYQQQSTQNQWNRGV